MLQKTERGDGGSDGGSEEYILDNVKGPPSAGLKSGHGENGDGLAIRVTTEYSLESEGVSVQSVGVGSSRV